MTESTEAANGAEKSPGTNGHAAPVPAAIPSRERPSIPAARPFERAHSVGAADLEQLTGISSRTGVKLQSTTRFMNAFMAHVTTVCGRQPDQLTEADMTILSGMLASLEKLETSQRRTHS